MTLCPSVSKIAAIMRQDRVAWFISPHGFGHAARAAAVMEALRKKRPRIEFEIFTRVPEWFFEDSLTGPFNYHPLVTDVGLVQETALREDAARTLERLDQFLPFEPILVERLAREVRQLECRCVICDIAPLGIAVAHQAGIPSVLVENFTWDWIYETHPGLGDAEADKLFTLYYRAAHHAAVAPGATRSTSEPGRRYASPVRCCHASEP